jgi:hypothetical protein
MPSPVSSLTFIDAASPPQRRCNWATPFVETENAI